MAFALVGFEGFDEYALADVYLVSGYGGSSTNGAIDDAATVMGMPEGKCLRGGNGGSWNVVNLTPNAEWTIGFHYAPRQSNTSGTLLRLYEGGTAGTEHMRLAFNADGTITISRAGSIPASSAALTWTNGVTHWIEVYYKCHDTTGAWEVKVDGVSVIGPTSSLDTRNGGTAGTPDTINFATGASQAWNIDNVYWGTGSGFLGEGRCVTDLVTADGANTAWTASAGSDYQCVDEATQNGDTDYISSATAAQRDSFAAATFGVTGTIAGLILSMFARKDDAGARSVQQSLHKISGGTDYDGATHTLSTSTVGYRNLWATDPSTAAAWVDTDVDGFEIGVENQ